MTRADLREIYTIAAAWPALVFWTRGNEGDWQPLLMPVTSDMLAEQ